MATVKMPKLPRAWKVTTYSDEQIAALFEACDRLGTPFTSARMRCILALLLDAGLRAQESLSIQMGEIDPHTGVFEVRGKGSRERTVAIGAFARKELWSYLQLRRKIKTASTALFIAQGGKPMTYWALRSAFTRLKAASGVEVKGGVHICRHTAATLMYRAGMRGASLQALMGHSAFDVTRRFYLDMPKQALAQEHELYAPLDNLHNSIEPAKKGIHGAQAERELNERGRWVTVLPDGEVLLREVHASSFRAVGRRYGVSDTAIRQRLKKAGLL